MEDEVLTADVENDLCRVLKWFPRSHILVFQKGEDIYQVNWFDYDGVSEYIDIVV